MSEFSNIKAVGKYTTMVRILNFAEFKCPKSRYGHKKNVTLYNHDVVEVRVSEFSLRLNSGGGDHSGGFCQKPEINREKSPFSGFLRSS